MRILLDTHFLIWSLSEPAKLRPAAKGLIEANSIFVSVVSIWEISIKHAAGKLAVRPADVLAILEPTGFGLIPVTGLHAVNVASLPRHHHDPFDRMLVTQAQEESMRLLTNDKQLAAYGDFVIVV